MWRPPVAGAPLLWKGFIWKFEKFRRVQRVVACRGRAQAAHSARADSSAMLSSVHGSRVGAPSGRSGAARAHYDDHSSGRYAGRPPSSGRARDGASQRRLRPDSAGGLSRPPKGAATMKAGDMYRRHLSNRADEEAKRVAAALMSEPRRLESFAGSGKGLGRQGFNTSHEVASSAGGRSRSSRQGSASDRGSASERAGSARGRKDAALKRRPSSDRGGDRSSVGRGAHPESEASRSPDPTSDPSSRSPGDGDASSAPAPAAGESVAVDGSIVIHVCDENRKVNKDFVCDRELLVREMRYFRTYLTAATRDVDISVHCDVHIFEWLMRYINRPDTPPSLEVKSVVSILISSNFLQMGRLVGECLQFIHDHFNSIVKLPIDLNCLGPELQTRLARLFTDEELYGLADRKDKLLSKLYMKRLEQMFESDDNSLFCCVSCRCLYTSAQRGSMECSKAKVFVDFHGNAISRHVPDRSWSLNKFIQTLREQGMAWRSIYWRLWGMVNSMTCRRCGEVFMCAAYGHCLFHPVEPRFEAKDDSTGTYPCCGAAAYRFDTASRSIGGCQARNHEVNTRSSDGDTLRVLVRNMEHATVPYAAPADTDEGRAGSRDGDGLTDSTGKGNDPASAARQSATSPLTTLAMLGTTGDGTSRALGSADGGAGDSGNLSSAGRGAGSGYGSGGGTDSRPASRGRSHSRDARQASDGEESVLWRPESRFSDATDLPLTPLAGGRRGRAMPADPARMSPRRYRVVRIDTQRNDDEAHMQNLMQSLHRLRDDPSDSAAASRGGGAAASSRDAPRTPFGM